MAKTYVGREKFAFSFDTQIIDGVKITAPARHVGTVNALKGCRD